MALNTGSQKNRIRIELQVPCADRPEAQSIRACVLADCVSLVRVVIVIPLKQAALTTEIGARTVGRCIMADLYLVCCHKNPTGYLSESTLKK